MSMASVLNGMVRIMDASMTSSGVQESKNLERVAGGWFCDVVKTGQKKTFVVSISESKLL
jgi:hypothetical protein